MKQKNVVLLSTFIMLLLLVSNIGYCAETTDALSVFKLPVGAKPISCGGAYNSVSGYINSVFYNPAGLANLEKLELTTTVGLLSLDRILNSIGIAVPIKFITIGLGVLNSGVGKINQYDSEMNKGDEFSYQVNSIFLSFGKEIQNVNFGLNLKVLIDNMNNYSRNGFATDIGVISNIKENLSVGAKIQNLVGVIGNDVLPIRLCIAGSYKVIEPINILTDIIYNLESEDFNLNLGLQYTIGKFLYLGCGVNNKEFSFGIGVNITKLSIIYAFSTDQFNLNNLHFISLGVKF